MVTKQGVMSGQVQILPKSPHKFVRHLQNLLKTSSPQKMKLLKEAGLFTADCSPHKDKKVKNVIKRVHTLKKSRKSKARRELQSLVFAVSSKKSHETRRALGMKMKTYAKYTYCGEAERKKRNDTLCESTVEQVSQLYSKHATILAT